MNSLTFCTYEFVYSVNLSVQNKWIHLIVVRVKPKPWARSANRKRVARTARAWLAMSGFVSVGYTPQTTDICVCCRHVDNVSPTRQRHSLMLALFFADKVVSGNRIPDTLSCVFVGISTNEEVTTYKDKKNWDPLRFFILSQVLVLVIFICVTFNCTVFYVQSY